MITSLYLLNSNPFIVVCCSVVKMAANMSGVLAYLPVYDCEAGRNTILERLYFVTKCNMLSFAMRMAFFLFRSYSNIVTSMCFAVIMAFDKCYDIYYSYKAHGMSKILYTKIFLVYMYFLAILFGSTLSSSWRLYVALLIDVVFACMYSIRIVFKKILDNFSDESDFVRQCIRADAARIAQRDALPVLFDRFEDMTRSLNTNIGDVQEQNSYDINRIGKTWNVIANRVNCIDRSYKCAHGVFTRLLVSGYYPFLKEATRDIESLVDHAHDGDLDIPDIDN